MGVGWWWWVCVCVGGGGGVVEGREVGRLSVLQRQTLPSTHRRKEGV